MQSTAHRRRLVRRHLVVIPKAAARVRPFLAGEFTGKPRDAETGLVYFGFRYNSSTLGRWMTPDPAGNLVASPANPQSWNQYAYVLNNPATLVDPFGLFGTDPAMCSTSAGMAYCPGTSVTVNGDGAIIDTVPIPVPLGAVIGTVGTGSAPSSGRGGGGSTGAAHNNAQQEQDRLNEYSNSAIGESVRFISLYNFVDNLKSLRMWTEWTVLPAAKATALSVLKKASSSIGGTEIWSITSGVSAPTAVVSAPVASGISAVESLAAVAAPVAIVGATAADINMHVACSGRPVSLQATFGYF